MAGGRAASAPPGAFGVGSLLDDTEGYDDKVRQGKKRQSLRVTTRPTPATTLFPGLTCVLRREVPNYVSRVRPVVHGVPHRDKEGVKRAMTPISSWNKMGLPLPSRVRAREAMIRREIDGEEERTAVLSSDRIQMYKATIGAVPESEWKHHWARRGSHHAA